MEPITSYGIILCTMENDTFYYLISQRRDTIEYDNLIRGIYNINSLQKYINLMTKEEHLRLLNYPFEDLWDDLWINHYCSGYKNGYLKAKHRFDSLKNNIDEAIKNSNKTKHNFLKWGFPKGRINFNEKEINCALREFREETCINIDYKNVINIQPSIEIFKGSNGKLYSTKYYIAFSHKKLEYKYTITENSKVKRLNTRIISSEVSKLKWITLQESSIYLSNMRKKLLNETNKNITNYFSN